MKSKFLWVWLVFLLVPALVLTSCGKATPEETAVPKEELVLNYAVNDFENNYLDPSLRNEALLGIMYDGFFPIDTKTGKLTPGVIKKWEMSPDGLSWTFYLRDDVFFHEGVNADGTVAKRTKVTAADIAFSLKMYVAKDSHHRDAYVQFFGDSPSTQIIDDYTIRVNCPAPSARLAVLASDLTTPVLRILPKAYIEKNGLDYFRAHPIGSGPYRFVRLVPNDVMEFEAVDNHWTGVVPDFKRVIISLIPEETTRVYMLQKGMIDVTSVSLDNALDLEEKGFGLITTAAGQSQFNFIGMYLPEAKGMPLADVRVRQALSLAINRQEICDTLLHGLGSVPDRPQALNTAGDDVSAWLADKWIPRLKNSYRYDPEEAKRLIRDAGYPDGFSFDLWWAPDTSSPFLGDFVMVCAGYFEAVGAKANVIPVDAATWKANRRPPLSMAMVGKVGASGTSLAKPVASQQLAYWITEGSGPGVGVRMPDQAKFDTLWKTATNSFDIEEYTKAIDQMLEMTTSQWVVVPIVDSPMPNAYGPRVIPVVPPGSSYLSGYFASWKYTGK